MIGGGDLVAAFQRGLRQIGVALFEGRDFLACRALEIHGEPEHRDEEPGDAGGDVLGDLFALILAELGNLGGIGSELCLDGRARSAGRS